jgi:hypothetical protein
MNYSNLRIEYKNRSLLFISTHRNSFILLLYGRHRKLRYGESAFHTTQIAFVAR